jgi:CubicO group peptidase (beta-lactamase class C family)
MNRKGKVLSLTISLALAVLNVMAQPISSKQIDSLVELTLKTFDVPGIAVAVVKDDKVVHAKGYGVRSLNTMKRVDENTLFGIASNSKAFTTTALGILVDEGKLKWDDKVVDYLPDFGMYDAYVTGAFTVRDLVTHRSGLGLGAGDLMFWPDVNTFTKKEIIHNIRYLKPVSGFRAKYDYDNLLYMVAGEVVAKVSGMSWEDFISTRILQPLGMNATAPSFKLLKDSSNVIDPHAPVNGKVQVVRRDWSANTNAAGGIYSNLTDMCKWITMHMNDGKYGPDLAKTLVSKEVHDELWTPQTIIPVYGADAYSTHFSSYGLGFFLSDVKGYKQATHTGGLLGIVTQVTLLPELKLGIIVFTNQQVGAAFRAITNTIEDGYLGVKGIDRVKEQANLVARDQNRADSITNQLWNDIKAKQKTAKSSFDNAVFKGTYNDPWFGDVEILNNQGKLFFESKRSPLLSGEMFLYNGTTFIVKWNDRSLDADAFVDFTMDNEGKASQIKMKPISPLTDFSFDFQDLYFTRVTQ